MYQHEVEGSRDRGSVRVGNGRLEECTNMRLKEVGIAAVYDLGTVGYKGVPT